MAELLRRIAAGDARPEVAWLTRDLLGLLSDEFGWVSQHDTLCSLVALAVARVAPAHAGGGDAELAQMAAALMRRLWEEKRDSCMAVGRDLLMALKGAASPPLPATAPRERLTRRVRRASKGSTRFGPT